MSSFSSQSFHCPTPSLAPSDSSTEYRATALQQHVLSSITNMDPGHTVTTVVSTRAGSGSRSSAPNGYTDSRITHLDPVHGPTTFLPGRESSHSANPAFTPLQTNFSHGYDPSTPSPVSSSSDSSSHVLLTPIYGESEPPLNAGIMDVSPIFGLALDTAEDDGSCAYQPEPAGSLDSEMWIAPCSRTTLPTSDIRSSMPSAALDNSEFPWSGWYDPEYAQTLQGFSEAQFGYDKDHVSGPLLSHQHNPHLYLSSVYNNPLDYISSSNTSRACDVENNITQPTVIPSSHTPSPTSSSLQETNQLTVLQPRPRRCIPIISLSEIASSWGIPSKDNYISAQAALSPLDLRCCGNTTASPQSQHNLGPPGDIFSATALPEDDSTNSAPSYYRERVATEIISCSCGCRDTLCIPSRQSIYLA